MRGRIGLIAVVAALVSMVLNLQFDSDYRFMDAAGPMDRRSNSIDRLNWMLPTMAEFKKDARGGGLFLSFKGYTSDNDYLPIRNYFLAVYALYPHPAQVAMPDAILVNQTTLLENNRLPDDPWLKAHDIRGVLTYFRGSHQNDRAVISP